MYFLYLSYLLKIPYNAPLKPSINQIEKNTIKLFGVKNRAFYCREDLLPPMVKLVRQHISIMNQFIFYPTTVNNIL